MTTPPDAPWKIAAIRSLLCLAFYLAGWTASWLGATHTGLWLFIAACMAGGWGLARHSWEDLRRFRLEIHFLMFAAAVASAALGQWPEAALLLVLFSGSEALESYANHRTERALASLFKDTPRTALEVLPDGATREVPVEDLVPGMKVRIPPGQQIPVDLRVVSGESTCDESSLTGEAIPVSKSPGSETMGGTMNLSGSLTGEVLRPASQSALQQIMELIREAQQRKAVAQRFTDKFGTRYTAGVLVCCSLLFLYWWLVAKLPPLHDTAEVASAFRRAITVLIVASPCALVLSVPSAILSAIARGARSGIIFRGGSTIEDLAKVDTFALDKTGTLTTGNLRVEEITPVRGNIEAIRHAAYNLALQTTHPLDRAIVRKLAESEQAEAPKQITQVPGKGVTAELADGIWLMGKRSYVETQAALPDEENLPRAPVHSEVWLAGGQDNAAYIRLRDEPRAEAAALLGELHKEGLRTVMLTGDRQESGDAVAKLTGVQEVHARLLPQDKTRIITEMQQAGRHVAMVGDGVNDAPALAAAQVGIAMGLRGSDAAREQADLVLSRDRLETLLTAWRLSRRATRIMRQNIGVALGVAGSMVLISILREVPLWVGVLTHEGSTAIVVLNSLRLLLGDGKLEVTASTIAARS
jgi:Cd2+/Zn2+-exporting ATPase